MFVTPTSFLLGIRAVPYGCDYRPTVSVVISATVDTVGRQEGLTVDICQKYGMACWPQRNWLHFEGKRLNLNAWLVPYLTIL